MKFSASLVTAALAGLLSTGAHAVGTTVVDFSSGSGGWTGFQGVGGGTTVDASLGNAAPALHTVLENFGIAFSNSSAAFTGDYSLASSITFSLDVLANSITYFGSNVSRSLILELRDFDSAINGYPYASVWITLGTLNAVTAPGWQHLSVTIADTASPTLPAGWGGYGDEDDLANPRLPAGVTFASILKGVDEIAFSTLVPGYAYGFTDFDVAIDNVSVTAITAVPEPGSMALMGIGGLALLGGARRRKTAGRA